jgi:hypothetical protein
MADDQPPFDLAAAHRYFAAECFNGAWDLIDKSPRTPAEDEQMLLRTFASFYHWSQRPECTAENRSVSLWQVSRAYALLGQPENARRYAEQSRAESEAPDLPPYCLGYAYEALARAEMLAGNKAKMQEYLDAARKISGKMTDEELRQMLLKDLETIQ